VKQNYLFRDRSFLARQVFWAWIVLLGSTLLFVATAVILSLYGVSQDFAVGEAFLITALIVFGVHYYLYQHNYRLFFSPMVIQRQLYILNRQRFNLQIQELMGLQQDFDIAYQDTVRMKSEVEQMRTNVVKLRDKAKNKGYVRKVKEIDYILGQVRVLDDHIGEIIKLSLQIREQIEQELLKAEKSPRNYMVVPNLIDSFHDWVLALEPQKRKKLILQQRIQRISFNM
jgi:hypothetical protein